MKPYFAKELPTEGEIKRGDRYLHPNGFIQQLAKDVSINLLPGINKKGKLVKLFLCSREVKPEDILDESIKVHIHHSGAEPPFKVIGKISAGAKWIKEGDEFDEKNLVVVPEGASIRKEIKHWRREQLNEKADVYIKCPCCGTFK